MSLSLALFYFFFDVVSTVLLILLHLIFHQNAFAMCIFNARILLKRRTHASEVSFCFIIIITTTVCLLVLAVGLIHSFSIAPVVRGESCVGLSLKLHSLLIDLCSFTTNANRIESKKEFQDSRPLPPNGKLTIDMQMQATIAPISSQFAEIIGRGEIANGQ